jgi:hypothetical protein
MWLMGFRELSGPLARACETGGRDESAREEREIFSLAAGSFRRAGSGAASRYRRSLAYLRFNWR